METLKTENEMSLFKLSIKNRDLISEYMFGMKGLYSTYFQWNDLMPVVKKVSKYILETDFKSKRKLNSALKAWKPLADSLLRMTDPEDIAEALLSFIQWYNENNPKK
jgi:hypothetical protein